MKRLLLIASIAVLCLACTTTNSERARYNIIPQPNSLIEDPGYFTLPRIVKLYVGDESFQELSDDFSAQLSLVSAARFHKVAEHKADIIIRKDEKLPDEAYRLLVSKKQVIIEAGTAAGAFYGVQSFYHLLPSEAYGNSRARKVQWKAPCCRIEDAPMLQYRGMMLDCGRYFIPKEDVLKFIDLMAMNKQNVLHWHLTEDQGWRIEIKKYPRLTEVGAWRKETVGYLSDPHPDGTPHGGFYTQEDAKEVVEYARKRFITVVPEVEIPGHSTAAIAAYPELSCFPDREYEVATSWGIKKDVYCPSEYTFSFLEDVFTELFEIFPSEYYHIGGDECPRDAWMQSAFVKKFMKEKGLKDYDQVQIYFVQRMTAFLMKHGKKVIGWDEILDGGAVPQTIAMSYRGHAPAAKAMQRDMLTILAPNRWCYLDNPQEIMGNDFNIFMPIRKCYDYNPLSLKFYPDNANLTEDRLKYVLGVQGCLWGEYLPTVEEDFTMAFPRNIALAESAWTSQESKDWDSFRLRLLTEFERLEQKGIPYSDAYYKVLFKYQPKGSFPKELELSLDYPFASIHYTLDGSEPTVDAPTYTQAIMVEEGSLVKAVAIDQDGKMMGEVYSKQF